MRIKSIEEDTFKFGEYYGEYDGLVITLENDETLKIGISNYQSCCESWGYITSEDNYEEFIGAEYYGVEVVDEALSTKTVVDVYEGGVMFVNIKTSAGVLQVVAYNEHNGYYGHSAVVVQNEVETHCECL